MKLGLRSALSWIAGLTGIGGLYPSTDPARQILSSAFRLVRNEPVNRKLAMSLPQLIAQSRYLESSCGAARGIVEGAKADLVGTGIDVEPKCEDEKLRQILRDDWLEWTEDCTLDGQSLWDLQRQARSEWMLAGASLWVYRVVPERSALGKLPLVIQALEVEWLTPAPVEALGEGNTFVAGVELNADGVPVAYHTKSPEDILGIDGKRLPAALIDHGYERRRPRQARGEPEFAPVIERLQQDDQLVTVELRAANNTAAPAFVLKSNNPKQDLIRISPGSTAEIGREDELIALANPRPSEKIAPFRGVIRGDQAAATGVSQQWIDRDSSRANFSSARMDELLTQRLNAPKRNLFGKYTASCPYIRLVPWIMLRRGRAMPRDPKAIADLLHHEIVPDEAESVDRIKAAEASELEIRLGLSTRQRECGRRGGDWRKNIAQQALEKAECDKVGLPYLPEPPAKEPVGNPARSIEANEAAADAARTEFHRALERVADRSGEA